MADPMTREKLRDLLSDMECGAGPDGGDIMAACDDLIAQERAEVERLRAELATRTDERDDAMNGWKKADTEAEQLREALDKTRDHRTYLQDRLGKAQKEAAGRKRYGDNLRTESERLRAELAETTYVLEVTGEKLTAIRGQRDRAEAERDRLAEELRKTAAYLYRRADLDADLSPSESRALATELRDAAALDGTEAGR